MIRLSQLIAAAEMAPPERLEKALQILEGRDQEPELLTTEEVVAKFRISKRTVYRRLTPAETLAGRHWFRAEDVRRALSA
jgi:DNA invertase Pin-like site-specific DNA recombinase